MFLGQGVVPESYDPLVDVHEVESVRARLAKIRTQIRDAAEAMPTHRDYIMQLIGASAEALA